MRLIKYILNQDLMWSCCKMDIGDGYTKEGLKERKRFYKKIKKLFNILEINSLDMIEYGIFKLKNQMKKMYNILTDKIDCSECPFGNNECSWARCPTKDEWEVIKYYFEKRNKKINRK